MKTSSLKQPRNTDLKFKRLKDFAKETFGAAIRLPWVPEDFFVFVAKAIAASPQKQRRKPLAARVLSVLTSVLTSAIH